MFWKTETTNIENGKIITYKTAGRNTTFPAGTLLKNVIIESSFRDIKFETLYVPDTFEIGKRSNFQIIKKSGKYFLTPSIAEEKTTLKSFREFYRMSSKEALFFLYIPIIIIGIAIGIFSGLVALKIYGILVLLSFAIRIYTIKCLGDICLCVISPPYIYLLFRF